MFVDAQVNSAHSKNTVWMSYRDAYKMMLWFEKYSEPKNLIQNHLQLTFKDNAIPFENQQIALVSKSMRISLTIDEMGRVALPLLKSAYDENAELILNSQSEKNPEQTVFLRSVSITPRIDNTYDKSELTLACEQAFKFQQFLGKESIKNKRCIGVRFLFSNSDNAIVVKVQSDVAPEKTLLLSGSFTTSKGDEMKLKTVNFLFNQSTEKTRITTKSAPIAIVPIIE